MGTQRPARSSHTEFKARTCTPVLFPSRSLLATPREWSRSPVPPLRKLADTPQREEGDASPEIGIHSTANLFDLTMRTFGMILAALAAAVSAEVFFQETFDDGASH